MRQALRETQECCSRTREARLPFRPLALNPQYLCHTFCSVIKEHHKNKDEARIIAVINQLVEIFNAPANALHSRNGGLIGLAATGIALGVDMFQYADIFLEPLLSCFADPEPRIRYFACESMYNLCKCVKGEVLVYFNPIFDALSRVSTPYSLKLPCQH